MYITEIMFGINKEKKKIDDLLNEIRGDYDNLVKNFGRPRSVAGQFEIRYRDAIEYRLNLLQFLEAEKEAVHSLLGKAETRTQEAKPEKKQAVSVADNGAQISYADRLIQEFAERIKKYPEIIIHTDAAIEMKKLFGSLSCVEKDYWGTVDRILRGMYGSKRFRDTVDLEPEINRMCSPGTDGLPQALATYHRLLERFPRDYNAVEREEQRCLVNAAILLKRMQAEIIRALDIGSLLTDDDKVKLTEAKVYIDGMIDDFRLKDLGRFN